MESFASIFLTIIFVAGTIRINIEAAGISIVKLTAVGFRDMFTLQRAKYFFLICIFLDVSPRTDKNNENVDKAESKLTFFEATVDGITILKIVAGV